MMSLYKLYVNFMKGSFLEIINVSALFIELDKEYGFYLLVLK